MVGQNAIFGVQISSSMLLICAIVIMPISTPKPLDLVNKSRHAPFRLRYVFSMPRVAIQKHFFSFFNFLSLFHLYFFPNEQNAWWRSVRYWMCVNESEEMHSLPWFTFVHVTPPPRLHHVSDTSGPRFVLCIGFRPSADMRHMHASAPPVLSVYVSKAEAQVFYHPYLD